MSKPKAAAKAVAVTPAAPEKQRLVPEHLLVPLNPPDWPTNLSDEDAEQLFELIEEGGFLYQAAELLGVKKSTISKWRVRHKQFGLRLAEAEEIGRFALVDEINEFVQGDGGRDEAAWAKEKRENRMEIVRAKWPQIYKTSPFKAIADASNDVVIGVVVVPAKQPLLAHDVVDAEFSEVAVPAKVPA